MYALVLNDHQTWTSIDDCLIAWVPNPDELDGADGKINHLVAAGRAEILASFGRVHPEDNQRPTIAQTVQGLRDLAALLESSADEESSIADRLAWTGAFTHLARTIDEALAAAPSTRPLFRSSLGAPSRRGHLSRTGDGATGPRP